MFIPRTWFNLISLLKIFYLDLICLFATGVHFGLVGLVCKSLPELKVPNLHFKLMCSISVSLSVKMILTFRRLWIFFFRRSRPYSEVHQREAEEVPLNGFVKSRPVMLVDLKNYCAENHKNSDHGFQLEYEVCDLYKAP